MNITPVMIDGVEIQQDFARQIVKIEVSRIFKYQEHSGRANASTRNEAERADAKMLNDIGNWIESSKEHNYIKALQDLVGGLQFDLKCAYKAASYIL